MPSSLSSLDSGAADDRLELHNATQPEANEPLPSLPGADEISPTQHGATMLHRLSMQQGAAELSPSQTGAAEVPPSQPRPEKKLPNA